MGYIYKITNNVNQKIYIGQTRNLIKYRWQHHLWKGNHPEKPDTNYPLYRAMRKYGAENFQIEEIEETTDELLNEREIYWIQYYNSYVPNGYNCDLGGAGASKFDHQEILDYFLNDGERNACKTARYFGCSLTTVLKLLEANNLSGLGKFQPIYQININDGKIINEFESIKAAQDELNISKTQLWSAVNRQAKTAGGYAWCKVEDYENFQLQDHIDIKKVRVCCKETNQIFDSISDAVKWLKENNYASNPTTANISKVCNGERKTAYKFHWLKV